jgi:hypothetical protein
LGFDGWTKLLRGRWRKESDIEEDEGEQFTSAPKEVTGGGARGGATDLMTTKLAMPTKSLEREEAKEAVATSVCD